MTRLTDIVLPPPISIGWLHGLLSFTFALHFLFVLLTLGTAFFATVYYVVGQWTSADWLRHWDRDFLEWFFAHKSLAIVLGVGPILLMQVGNSIPFLTAVNLVAPLWMLIIVCLIGALALYEWQHRRKRERRWLFLLVSTVALFLLVYVPATFVAVLTSTERPGIWAAAMKLGSALPGPATLHWALRLLHVLGASVLVTAAVHYLGVARNEDRRRHMLGWMAGGLAFQFVGGVGLYASVRPPPAVLPTVIVAIGVAAAGLLGFVTSLWRTNPRPARVLVGLLLSLVLIPMLMTRQILQDRVLLPLVQDLRENAVLHSSALAPYRGAAQAAFAATLAVPYNNALAIYTRSCSFCHGAVGNGQGDSAGELVVRPENLTEIRLTQDKLHEILREGVRGSAMPVFDFYLKDEIALLRGFLREKVGLREPVEVAARPQPAAATGAAKQLFDGTCSVCHGSDGRGSATGLAFAPPVPDLTRLSVTPAYGFAVVSEGYPGTMMRSFASEPEEVRHAAVALIQEFYLGRRVPVSEPQPDGGT